MAVENIVARTYDIGQASIKQTEPKETKKIQDIIDDLIVMDDEIDNADCNCNVEHTSSIKHDRNISIDGNSKSDYDSSIVENAVSFSFSMFMQVSGDFENLGQDLGNQFDKMTSLFMNGLKDLGLGSPHHVDGYLKDAKTAASSGQETAISFIEQMKAKKKTSLTSMVNSQPNQSFMSNINLSTNSALPGTSGSDIAQLYLSAAAEGPNSMGGVYGMSGVGVNSSGIHRNDYGLELISKSSSSADVEPPKEQLTQVENSNYMEKFLDLMDSFSNKKQNEFMDRAVIQPSLASVEFGFDIHRYSSGLFNIVPDKVESTSNETVDQNNIDTSDKLTV